MSSREMNFNMRFTADASQAKNVIQQLQSSLSQIAIQGSNNGVSRQISEAASAAKELSYHLNQAYNATTGNFDLSKLDKSLKTSNTNITKLSSSLLQAGQSGQQAFVQLAQSIAAADRPAITLSSRMKDLYTTIKNTAKWQLSSSIIHGFMGAVQEAYGYAQDLNESLNNIRIVTGYNIDKMAQFAEEANKAAKALSTTTTQYTDASLIYYQQGLNDQQVKERTDVTIKMANVARESAQTVSDEMTAVWNNFYDGSKSLEYYADVLTALGAATASSTAEISQGLEKFAAISNTVGLSYEYASTALATVTAETRQSADIVGTAFKTMFARIQGLELGETLEDGTNLNQYSQALEKVGINIKDQNGDLKEMDDILNEMGSKWKTLSEDEQVALAQKVAGIRQYSQLIALMENWDKFQINLGTAQGAEGTLQEQADIYAESWEAARDRVQASLESIYSDLIDDSFFIDLTDGFAKLINSLDAFIDGFGGVKMIIISVASILMSIFANKIPGAIENLKTNFNILFQGASQQAQNLSKEMIQLTNQKLSKENFNISDKTALENAFGILTIKNKISAVQSQLTDKEMQEVSIEEFIIAKQQEELQILSDQMLKEQKNIDNLVTEMELVDSSSNLRQSREKEELALIRQKQEAQERFLQTSYGRGGSGFEEYTQAKVAYEESRKALNAYREETELITGAQESFANTLLNSYVSLMKNNNGLITNKGITVDVSDEISNFTEKIQQLQIALEKKSNSNNMTKSIQNIISELTNVKSQIDQVTGGSIPELDSAFDKVLSSKTPQNLKNNIQKFVDSLKSAKIPAEQLNKILSKMGYGSQITKLNKSYKTLSNTTQELTKKQQILNQKIKDFTPEHTISGIERITKAASGLGQVAMFATSIKSMFSALNDEDLSAGEKLITTFMSLSMIIPSARGALKNFNDVLSFENQTILSTIASKKLLVTTIQSEEMQTKLAVAAKALDNASDKESKANMIANILAKQGLIAETEKEIFATKIANGIKEEGNNKTTQQIITEQLLNLAKGKGVKSLLLSAQAQIFDTNAKKSGITAAYAHLAALIAEKFGVDSLNASLAPLLILLGLVAISIGGIVAIGAGLVYLFKQIYNELNKDNIAAQQAAELADNMAKKYETLTEEANKFKESVSNYETAVKSLETLKLGTEEYEEALKKANEEAENLIETYGLWSQVKGTNPKTGLIEFEQEALEDIQYQKNAEVSQAKRESNMASLVSNQKNLDIEISKFSKEIANKIGFILKSPLADTEKEKIKQSGNVYNVSDDITTFRQLTKSQVENILEVISKFDDLENMSSRAFSTALKSSDELGTELKEITPTIVENRKEFEKLAEKVAKVNAQEKYNEKEIISSLLKDKYGKDIRDISEMYYGGNIDSNSIENYIVSIISNKLMQNNENSNNKLNEQLSNIVPSGINNIKQLQDIEDINGEKIYSNIKSLEDLTKAYAEKIVGISNADQLQFEETDKGGSLKDISGEKVVDDVSTEFMLQQLDLKAQEEKIYSEFETKTFEDDEITENLTESLGNLLKGASQFGAEYGTDFTTALLEAINNEDSKKIDLTSLFKDINQEEFDKLIQLDSNELAENLGLGVEDFQNFGYNNAEEFEKAFDEGLSKWTPEIAKQLFDDSLNQKIEEEAEKYDLDPELLKDIADGFIELAEAEEEGYNRLDENTELVSDATIRYTRLQDAVIDLSENYDDYKGVLKNIKKASDQMDKAYIANSESGKKLKTSLAGLLGVSEDLVDVDLLEAINPSDFKAAAKGDADAIARIRDEFIKLQAEAYGIDFSGLKTELDNLDFGAEITLDNSQYLSKLIQAQMNAGMTAKQIESSLRGLGIDIDSSSFDTFYSSLEDAEAVAQATGGAIVNATSFTQEATANTEELELNGSEGEYSENIEPFQVVKNNVVTEMTDTGGGVTYRNIPSKLWGFNKYVETGETPTKDVQTVSSLSVKTINGEGKSGNVAPQKFVVIKGKKSVGNIVSPSTRRSAKDNMKTDSGSSSKPTKKQLTKKSEVVDRYKEVTDSLDDLTRKLDKANEKTDRLFGPAKIKNLKETNTLLKKQVGLISDQIKEAKGYLKTDKNKVNSLAGQLGLDFNYDKQGNIINYTPEMTKLYEQLNQTEKTYNSIKNKDKQDKYNEEVLQPLEEKIKALQEALGQYEETRELIQDLTKEQEEISLEIDTNEMKIITYTVEVQVDAAESEIEYVNYLLSEMEDTAYDAAQAIALLDKRLEALGTESSAITTGYEDLLKQKLSDKEVNLVMSGQANKIDWSKFQDDEDYEEWMNNLKSYAQQALQNNQALIDTQHEVNSQLTKTFESWVEEYDKGLAVFDHADRVYEGYTNIIDLLGNRSGISDKRKQQINQARVDNANNKLGASKDKLDDIKRDRTKTEGLLAKSKKGLENAKTDEEKKFWQRQIKDQEEALEKIKEEEQKAEEEYLQDWQSALETARDAFLANSEIQLKAFEKKMAGTYGSFEEMQNAFDKQSTKRKEYLQDYQKIYELNKLNRDLTKKLDETSNVKAKQALMEMQEEILKYQKDGVKMSEYDLEYLQKKYDLRVAEIALEEAQNAKTQVRLTRDSSGNYSYTYTTDENQTAEMAQTYEDKLNDLITLSNDYVEQQTSNLLSTQQEFVDTIAAINQKAAEGYFETDEAYQQALEETREYYQGRMEYFSSEIDKASKNNINVYQNEYSQYEGFIGGKIAIDHAHSEALNEEAQRAKDRYIALAKEYESQKAELTKQWQVDHTLSKEEYDKAITQLDEEFSGQIAQAKQDIETANSGIITNFTDTFLPQLEDKYSTAKSYVKDWSKKVGTVDGEKKTGVLGKMSTSYDNLVKNINTAMGNAGTSMDTFKTSVYNALLSDSKKNDSVKTISDATRDSLKELAKSADFSDAITNVKNWQKENATSLSAIIAKNNEAIKSYTDLASEISKQNKTGKKPKKDTTSQEPDTSKNDDKDDKDDKDDDTPGTVNNSKKIPGVAAAIWIKGPDTSGWGTGATRRKRLKAKGVEGAQEYINQHGENGDIYNDWNTKRDKLKNYYYGAFATGGYTGEWGSEGKLAVLHEKELVLNKEDTKNMLDIISVVRTMIDSLDFQSRLSNLASLSLINNTSLPSMNKDESVNQTVNITAEFPAATDRHEIEQAFNLLKNKASQYVNKK